jgi:hypothetical protein
MNFPQVYEYNINIKKINKIKYKISYSCYLKIEMGIEKDTLFDSEGNDLGNLIEMPNGCLCCVAK